MSDWSGVHSTDLAAMIGGPRNGLAPTYESNFLAKPFREDYSGQVSHVGPRRQSSTASLRHVQVEHDP